MIKIILRKFGDKLRSTVEFEKLNLKTGKKEMGNALVNEITSEKYGETIKYPDEVENGISNALNNTDNDINKALEKQ
jgi:hypothetical protein